MTCDPATPGTHRCRTRRERRTNMRNACLLLTTGVLWLGAGLVQAQPPADGPATSAHAGCASCGHSAQDDCCGGKKDKARRCWEWLTYRSPAWTGCCCLGVVAPAANPPLYTFFPCSGSPELPPHTLPEPCERQRCRGK